ncbi:hypothetical protein KFE25_005065 [Diacronema lutheri]|uniref:Uncharacterized protein n=3 Tax=Diacronema lutheri TaxID=2081491 RepID=A0A8J5X634_DIALT|nr:hypothetical protein KFE25_005065 [Diacronema lutheri]
MRVFVHCEDGAGGAPAHTLALALDRADGGPASRALDAFVASYNTAHAAHALRPAELALVDGRGAPLRLSAPLAACVSAGADLFVRPAAGLPEHPSPRPPSTAPAVAVGAPKRAAGAPAAPPRAEPTGAQAKALLAQGEAAFKAKNYRTAALAYEAVLEHNPRHRACLSRLAEIEAHCGRTASAAAHLEAACDAARSTALSAPTTPLLLARLAEAYVTLGRPRDAVRVAREALELCPDGDAIGGEGVQARRSRLLTLLGRALYDAGDRKAGADLFMAVLDKEPEQPEALAEYAAVALECGQLHDALKVQLRLIVKRPDDKKTRAALARVVAADDGCTHLFEQLAPSAAAASAHAFLGTVVKEASLLEQAERLYHAALMHAPAGAAASYALNLAHVLELSLKYDEALGVLLGYMRSPQARGRSVGADGPTVEQLAELLDDAARAPAAQRAAAPPSVADARGDVPPPPPALVAGAGEDLPMGGPLATPALPPAASSEDSASGYSTADLDLLGLLLTAAKILFVTGRLRALPALINAIEPARRGRQLHLTLVRNEHAYFCTVAQLLPTLRDERSQLPIPPHDRRLYVLGDSHCLPYGWRLVQPRGERVLLVPLLVTGLKAWHLRDECTFFPRANFWKAAEALPIGARCVSIFCEIDCREALLVCVARRRYASVDEGAAAVIAIYIRALLKLVRVRKLERLWVHAVPPVLNETRAVVLMFNAILKTHVCEAARTDRALAWLDGLDEAMLDGSGQGAQLNPQLKLDGTHMHPRCAQLLEAALERSGWPEV